MTNQEIVKALVERIGYSKAELKYLKNWPSDETTEDSKNYHEESIKTFEAMIELLRGKQPDAETGLVPCVYCNDTDDQANLFEENNYAPYSGMESAININRQQDGKHFVCADLWGGSNCAADFEIHFCPMCGRKLESE